MSNVPLATPVLPAAVTRVGRDIPYNKRATPHRATRRPRAHKAKETHGNPRVPQRSPENEGARGGEGRG